MPTYRALVTLPTTTGIVEDFVTNTFHFELDLGSEVAQMDAMDTALIAFYNTTGTGGMAQYLATTLSRVANQCSIRWYNLNDLKPRIPARTTTFTLAAAGTGNPLPAEVACCLSFEGAKLSGVNQARRRGRLYFGPLQDSVITVSSGIARPATAFTTRMRACASALRAAGIAASALWVVYSPTSDLSTTIASGWTDDAFDTQRRRGVRPTAKTTWT